MKYKPLKRANPRNRTVSKYYLQPIRTAKVGRDELEKFIVESTALSKAEARGVTVSVVGFIKDELLRGNAIDIEGLGTFSIRVRSEGSDTAEEVSADNVKSIMINYRPSAELMEDVRKIRFVKAD